MAKPLPIYNDCALYLEIGIVFCCCGSSLKTSQKTRHLDKKNYVALSIPGYVNQNNSPVVPNMDLLNDKDDKYRKYLSLIGWTEEQIIEHDKIALEDHS